MKIFALLTISWGLEDLFSLELIIFKSRNSLHKISNLLRRGTYSSFKVISGLLRLHRNRKWLRNRSLLLLLGCLLSLSKFIADILNLLLVNIGVLQILFSSIFQFLWVFSLNYWDLSSTFLLKLTSNEHDFLSYAGIACILRFLELLGKVPHLLFHFFKGFNLWNKFIKLTIFSFEQLGLRSNLV